MSTTTERVRAIVEPLVHELGASIYDVEHSGGVLRISLQRDDGLDMGLITEATRRISAQLDAADPLPERYTLEVSIPGLERALRTPEHFAGAVGEQVKIKVRPGLEGDRRVDGEVVAADGESVTVRTGEGDERRVALGDIERARTHVDWTPPPKPGSPEARRSKTTTTPPDSEGHP